MSGPAGERITVAEVGRRLERLEEDVKSLGSGLHRRLDDMNFVHPETLDTKLMLEAAHRNDLERRVAAIESNNQWVWRTIAGILLTAVLLGLLAASGLPS